MLFERNDPCSCGSGRKYKKCCLAKDEAEAAMRRAENQRRTEAAAAEDEAARRLRNEERARFAQARGSAPVGTHDGESAADRAAQVTLKLGWPPLPAESQHLVDAWWEEVNPVYMSKDGLEQSGWLLERTLAFLDDQPRLFRYLHLHDEFLLEVGSMLTDAISNMRDACFPSQPGRLISPIAARVAAEVG